MAPLRDVVAAWDTAALMPDPQAHIHPTGRISTADYDTSGALAAHALAHRIGTVTGRILDFGAGNGRVTLPLEELYPGRVDAADASPTMLDLLVERGFPRERCYCSDGVELAELGRWEVIVSLAVLIHHGHESGAAIIAGLTAALEPGGRLILDLPLYENEREAGAWNDVTTWTLARLYALATHEGLAVERANVSAGEFHYGRIGAHHGDLVELRA